MDIYLGLKLVKKQITICSTTVILIKAVPLLI
jgi:hypothetical protein